MESREEQALEPRVDRTAFAVFSSFAEAEAADEAYWQSRTPAERLAHLELLRRMCPERAPQPQEEAQPPRS